MREGVTGVTGVTGMTQSTQNDQHEHKDMVETEALVLQLAKA